MWVPTKNVWTVAKNTWEKGLQCVSQPQNKKHFRSLWIQRINAAAFRRIFLFKTDGCSQQGIAINRKVLADLAMNPPEAFSAIVQKAKNA